MYAARFGERALPEGSWRERERPVLFELLSGHEPFSEVLLIINGLRRRFMESSLFLFELPSAHEPESRKCLEIKEATLRFMESHLFLFELPSVHEPENRKSLEINGAILRFMESCLGLTAVPTNHEPGRDPLEHLRVKCSGRNILPVCESTFDRSMESCLGLVAMPGDHEPVPPAFDPASALTRKSAVRGRVMASAESALATP